MLAFAGLLICGETVQGQPVLDAQVDTQEIAVGEPVELLLRLDHNLAEDARWDWPVVLSGDTLEGGWEVLRAGPIDTLMSDAFSLGRQLQQRIQITHWDSGLIAIAPLVYLDTVGDQELATTEIQIRVTVPEVLPEVALRDIQGFESIAWTFGERVVRVLPWLIGVLLLAWLVWRAWKFWKAREPEERALEDAPATPAEPHHIVALRALRALEKEQLWQKGGEKDYHGRLTAAVKTFVEGQFDTPMVDRSTSEIRRMLVHPPAGLSRDHAAQLMALLDSADAVKFAKHKPGADVHERAMRQAINLVESLIPEDEPDV